MNVLGIIPAKGTSTAVPRKNLAPLHGKPLLWWTIDAAIRSERLSGLLVTSDDHEILDGAMAWFSMRAWPVPLSVVIEPPHFAAGGGDTLGVLQWNVNQLDRKPDAVMCLQPTCPLRRTEDIDGAIDLLERTGCDSVVSYVSVGANHPARMARITDDGRVFPIDTADTFVRRQDLPAFYIRSGDIYLTRTDVLLGGSLVGKDQRAWKIDSARWANIDEPIDLKLTETRMEYLQGVST